MAPALVGHQRARVQRLFRAVPDVLFRVPDLPQRGIGQIPVPCVQLRLVALAIGSVGHARTGSQLAAKDIAPAQQQAVARLKRGASGAREGFPRRLRRTAVVFIRSVRGEIAALSRNFQRVRRMENGLPPRLRRRVQPTQELRSCLLHVLPPEWSLKWPRSCPGERSSEPPLSFLMIRRASARRLRRRVLHARRRTDRKIPGPAQSHPREMR